MTASQVAAAATRTGADYTSVTSVEALIESCEQAATDLVIVDLLLPGLDVANLVERLSAFENPPRQTIGFGPHVHAQRLAAARAAGLDAVLTRGDFHRRVDEILSVGVGPE